MRKQLSIILILIFLLNVTILPVAAVSPENQLQTVYKQYIEAVRTSAPASKIQQLKNKYESLLKSGTSTIKTKTAAVAERITTSQPEKPKSNYYNVIGIRDQEHAKSIGAVMTMGATAIACAASFGILGPVGAAVIAAGLAIPGTYMWQWGTKKLNFSQAANNMVNIKTEIKKKEIQNSVGVVLDIAGLGLLTAGALGLMGALPAIAIGSTLSIAGSYLWHWGFDLPDFLKPKSMRDNRLNSKERAVENAGVIMGISGTAAIALGSLAFVPTAPAILAGSMLSIAGAYLWKFGFGRTKTYTSKIL